MAEGTWTPEEDALLRSLHDRRPRLTHDQIAEQIRAAGHNRTNKACRRHWEKQKRGQTKSSHIQVTDTTGPIDLTKLRETLRTPRSLRELSGIFDRSEDTVAQALRLLRDEHYNVIEVDNRVRLDRQRVEPVTAPRSLLDLPGMEICLGLPTDTQFGSKQTQYTAFRSYVRRAVDMGVTVFLVAGDLFAGNGRVYRGQVHDLHALGADVQLRLGERAIPQIPGVRWYIIGGNHDYSFMREDGFNIVEALADRRPDITYCGYDVADLPLTDGADVRLWHPRGGLPYAASYRLQKGMEAAAFEELQRAATERRNPKLRAVFAGHLHIAMQMMLGTILGMQCGCFESQTGLLKAAQKYIQVGAYVVKLRLTDGGLIQSIAYEWLQGDIVEDDWRNYPELTEAPPAATIEPLFQWVAEV